MGLSLTLHIFGDDHTILAWLWRYMKTPFNTELVTFHPERNMNVSTKGHSNPVMTFHWNHKCQAHWLLKEKSRDNQGHEGLYQLWQSIFHLENAEIFHSEEETLTCWWGLKFMAVRWKVELFRLDRSGLSPDHPANIFFLTAELARLKKSHTCC